MTRAGLTTAVVTRAAAELADEEGFAAVTVSAVARRLRVRTPSLYSHVDGNADLRLRVTALALDEAADAVTAAVASLSGRSALTALADAWRDFAVRHPGRYAATRQPVPSSATDAAVAAIRAGRRHAGVLRSIVDRYPVAEGDAVHAVRLVGSVVHGFVTLELGGGFAHSDPPSDDSWDYTLAALDRALGH